MTEHTEVHSKLSSYTHRNDDLYKLSARLQSMGPEESDMTEGLYSLNHRGKRLIS